MKKMYSDMDNPDVQMIMKLIEKRDLMTLIRWIAAISRTFLCPRVAEVEELTDLLENTDLSKEDRAALKTKLTAMRRSAAAEKDPALQASLRAVSTGAAVISTPSNALGSVLYLAMAAAYLNHDPMDEETCLKAAQDVLAQTRAMLEETPEAAEGFAVKVKWNC